jgi:hypothetical protein
MSQANVYTSAANAVWYTDKASISTGNTAVTFNVYAPAVGSVAAVGNIYSNAVSVPATSVKEIYVGVGNQLTISGANFTVQELGTASSAQAGVIGNTYPA